MKLAALALSASLLALQGVQAREVKHPTFGTWGVDLAAIDRSVKPGDDFFMYVNGNWYKTAVIPPDRASTGSSQDLRILSEKRMQEIAASLDSRPRNSLNDEERKLRDFYDAYMDQKQIDSRGLTPAKKDIAYLSKLKTLQDVAAAMGSPMLQLDGPFSGGIAFNPKDTNQYVLT